jgi:hypothetical protein
MFSSTKYAYIPFLELSLKLDVLESVISFKTSLRTHGQLYKGLKIEIWFLPGSLDRLIASHKAVFVFLFFIVVEEVRHSSSSKISANSELYRHYIIKKLYLCCPLTRK